jgi:peptidyl-prolyl cis-trans isomerase SurA
MMKTILTALLFVMLSASLGFADTPLDGVVAVVNSEPITRHELSLAVAPYLDKARSDGPLSSEDRARLDTEILEGMINDMLVVEEAKRMGLEAKREQVDAQLSRLKEANGWSDDQLAEALKGHGFGSLSAYRERMERELLKNQVMGIKVASRVKVDEADVERTLARELKDGSITERRASHILIKVEDYATEAQIREAEKKLEALRGRALAGETTFEELARAHSQDGSAASGGDLGWFGKGELDPTFEKVAFQLKKDEVSVPVRTPFGVHLVKMVSERNRRITGDGQRETLMRQIRFRIREAELERLYDLWLSELRDAAFIELK